MDLAGRVVIVTGASSGIGLATVRRAARTGAHVVLAARGERALKSAAAACEEDGAASAMVVPTDVGDDAAVAALVERVMAEHGRIDVVVSNAGVVSYGRMEDVPAEVFDGVLRTNLLGAANVARHVVPVLRRQERGSLLYVGSVVGHVAVPTMTAYCVSKWGVHALVRHLRLENRDVPGVHIGYVAPAGVDTPIYQQAANYEGYDGRPPPPASTPDRVARQILARVGGGHRPAQLDPVNEVLRFGYAALPLAYDVLIAPMFRLLALDLHRPVQPGPGNVLASREDGNAATGDRRPMLETIAGNVAVLLRRAAGRDRRDAAG